MNDVVFEQALVNLLFMILRLIDRMLWRDIFRYVDCKVEFSLAVFLAGVDLYFLNQGFFSAVVFGLLISLVLWVIHRYF